MNMPATLTSPPDAAAAASPDLETSRRKWPALLLLSLAELLVMAVWFSASAVVPALTDAWALSDFGRASLTMSVQIGFVVGAFGSALLTLPDRSRRGACSPGRRCWRRWRRR
jgi:hypothetical protein